MLSVETPVGDPRSFATEDPDEAREHVGRTFSEHDLHLRGGRCLEFRLDLVSAVTMTIGRMRYGADAILSGPSMDDCYHVNLTTAGSASAEQKGKRRSTGPGSAGVAFSPDEPLGVHFAQDAVQWAIKFPRHRLETHAAQLSGHAPGEPIEFDLTFDLSTAMGQSLLATASFMHAELSRPGGLAAMPMACSQLEATLMTQLLLVAPNQFSRALRQRTVTARRGTVREVVDYIDGHPDDAITTADLAARAGISVRALQAGFHDLVGMSPMTYLRGVRLDRVREELIAGGTGRSVTAVAAAWGFFHPGRFAQHYRARFDELPSETAREYRQG